MFGPRMSASPLRPDFAVVGAARICDYTYCMATPLCKASTSSRVRVACIGDSLTRGDGSHERRPPKRLAQRGNYPAKLQELLGTGFWVRNFGHGGATACNSSEIPMAATREFAAARRWRPDVAVLMLGTNDAKKQHWEAATPCGGAPAYRSGLLQLLRALGVAANVQSARRERPPPLVVLLHPPPVLRDRWGISRRLLPLVRTELRALFPPPPAEATASAAACARGRAVLMPKELPIAAERQVFIQDGIHLNARGSGALACAAFAELVRLCDWPSRCVDAAKHAAWQRRLGGECRAALATSPSGASTAEKLRRSKLVERLRAGARGVAQVGPVPPIIMAHVK